ncbi:MAG: sel1 repeat family protein [Synergistaceae bacterium]|nr:sel1 repeat family protein [Synergistaceae bacterium]
MRRWLIVLLAVACVALSVTGATASYEAGLEASRAGDMRAALGHWLTASADPRSMAAIATLYERGEVVALDMGAAVTWYRRAAERGNYRAMAHLAELSLRGFGAEHRMPMEWRTELEAVRGKDPYADYVLAFFYANGHGGERRLEDALTLLTPLAEMGYEPFVVFHEQVRRRLADLRDGVLEAEALAQEMARSEVSFDQRWKDKRIVVSGWVTSVKRIRDYGYVLRFGGPNVSVLPKDNLLAVFYAPLVTDPIAYLRQGDYVKLDGVYVGRHPFDLEPGALTLFGCDLLQATSGDLGR